MTPILAPHSATRPSDRCQPALHPSDRRQPSRRGADLLHWNSLWLALYLIGIGVFLVGMPKHLDDLWFMGCLREFLNQQGIVAIERDPNLFAAPLPFESIWNEWVWHYHFDNARFANIIVTPILMLPKWVGLIPVMLAWVYTMFASFKIAGIDWRRSAIVPLAICYWTFVIPWGDGMASLDFDFNYIIPTFLFLYLFKAIATGRYKSISPVGPCVAAFFLGWWHEGFSVPFICGLASLILFKREFRNKRIFAIFIAVLSGAMIILTSPALIKKVTDVSSLYTTSGWKRMILWIIFSSPYLLFLVLTAYARKSRKHKEAFKDEIFIFITFAYAAVVVVSIGSFFQPRVYWISFVLSLIGILYICKIMWHNYIQAYQKSSLWVSAPMLLLTFLYWGYVGYYSLRLRNDLRESFETYLKAPEKSVFGKVYNEDRMPFTVFETPSTVYYTVTILYINSLMNYPEHPFMIIPEELRNITAESGEPIAGNLNIRKYKGWLFRAVSDGEEVWSLRKSDLYYEADFGHGYHHRHIYSMKFKSEADGKDYQFFQVHANWLERYFMEIKGLREPETDL